MKKPFIKYIISLLLFGTNGIVASFIDLSSYEIVFFRTLIGSILLIAIFFITGGKPTFHKNKKDLFFIAISGVAMGTSWLFLYEAYAQLGVSVASLCYYCGAVIVMVLSPIVFKERLTAVKIIGFIAAVCGIVLVNGVGAESINAWGLFCGLMSAVTYSFMVMFNKKSQKVTGLENSMLQLFIAFLSVAIFRTVKNGFCFSVSRESIIPILILGVINTGIGCYFYFSSIGKLPVQTVAIFGYLEPVSAVVFSVLLLRETISPIQIVGAVLIVGGAIFAESKNFVKSGKRNETDG